MAMTLTEKAAYLKGLLDGMENKDKVTDLIADILRDMALEIEDINDCVDELSDAVMDIDDEFTELKDGLCVPTDNEEVKSFSDDPDSDEVFGEDDDDMYELTCPTCGEVLCINGSVLDEGTLKCPNCGEILEFDLDDIEDDFDDDDEDIDE